MTLKNQREEEKVHQLMMGLDDTLYGIMRSNVLAIVPLSLLSRVYATLVQEERIRVISQGKEEQGDVIAFASQARGRGTRGLTEIKDRNSICSICNRAGHEVENHLKLIIYPDL